MTNHCTWKAMILLVKSLNEMPPKSAIMANRTMIKATGTNNWSDPNRPQTWVHVLDVEYDI